jgi:hypothetical protein
LTPLIGAIGEKFTITQSIGLSRNYSLFCNFEYKNIPVPAIASGAITVHSSMHNAVYFFSGKVGLELRFFFGCRWSSNSGFL